MTVKQNYNTKSVHKPLNDDELNEKVRKVAQKLYEKRGLVPGHELADWLEAEKIVKSEYS